MRFGTTFGRQEMTGDDGNRTGTVYRLHHPWFRPDRPSSLASGVDVARTAWRGGRTMFSYQGRRRPVRTGVTARGERRVKAGPASWCR